MKKIGIIGCTGRMGQLLQEKIAQHKYFISGPGFSKSKSDTISLAEVFSENDYVVDFSKPELMQMVLEEALNFLKPLVICTTGWQQDAYQDLLNQVAKKMPIVIASNTSIGAYIQRYITREVAKILGNNYDIDIVEKHHRNKIDIPSGTANSLIQDIQDTKKLYYGMSYQAVTLKEGPRPENIIGVNVQRTGNIPGDHEISFTSPDEMISIRHVAFNRDIFAQGAIKIAEWLEDANPPPGLYTMEDILCPSSDRCENFLRGRARIK